MLTVVFDWCLCDCFDLSVTCCVAFGFALLICLFGVLNVVLCLLLELLFWVSDPGFANCVSLGWWVSM